MKDRTGGAPGRSIIDLISMQPGWTLEANGILNPRESEYEVQYALPHLTGPAQQCPRLVARADHEPYLDLMERVFKQTTAPI